jgi:hypothetical protein
MGYVHGWDLRSHEEAWVLKVTPDLGFLTAMVLGADQVGAVCSVCCVDEKQTFVSGKADVR